MLKITQIFIAKSLAMLLPVMSLHFPQVKACAEAHESKLYVEKRSQDSHRAPI